MPQADLNLMMEKRAAEKKLIKQWIISCTYNLYLAIKQKHSLIVFNKYIISDIIAFEFIKIYFLLPKLY